MDNREEFEAAYVAHLNERTGKAYRAEDMAALLEGTDDSPYGDRAYLNGGWWGWQAALSRSQDAPRCQCCGYLVTESEHRGCLRSAERSQDVARVADEPSEAQKVILAEQESLIHPATQVFFRAGLLACREYMARFVQHESPTIAASIRANWWPSLGQDFGPPRKLEWSEMTVGEYGEEGFRAKTADEVSPTQEALPVALGFLQSIDPGYRRATIDMGMERSIKREFAAAPQPPQAGANEHEKVMLDAILHGTGFMKDGKHVPREDVLAPAAPAVAPDAAPAEPKGEQQDDYEAKGTIEHLDLDNHRLRRAMQKIMARLAELLDEDQFANIESIVKGVGVEPPEQRAATLTADAIECLRDVVSHHDNIVAGLCAQKTNAVDAQDGDSVAYWNHEISVARRMKEQADRFLHTLNGGQEWVS